MGTMRPALLALVLSCCRCVAAEPAVVVDHPVQQVVYTDELGLGFELPSDWTSEREGEAWVYAGPAGSHAFYTPLSIQAVHAPDAALDAFLEATYADAELLQDARLGVMIPLIVGDRLALAYDVSFELYEQPRRRIGVLLPLPPFVVDVSYAAVQELFPGSVAVFEHALSTLYIEPE